jgi:DNA polymerase III alpha subunit
MKSEYSFNHVYGKLEDVHKRALELGFTSFPLDDIMSTFGFVKWDSLCEKANVKPIFGVTLGVSAQLGQKRPATSYFTFFAINKLRTINELIGLATGKAGHYPLLTYEETINHNSNEVISITDSKVQLGRICPHANFYIALNPATSIGLFREAKSRNYQFIAHIDNRFTYQFDRLTYHTLIKNAEENPYPQWLLGDEEWRKNLPYIVTDEEAQDAIDNRNKVFEQCNAKLLKAEVFKPKDSYSLRDIALQGAEELNVNMNDPIYAERFERELKMIEEKGYSDYFYIVSDLVKYAKSKMIVGPGRGSSAGSLMCYLTGITTIDPIKYGLLFERFIDVTRKDLPDIDLDFSDQKRHLVFDYLGEKYGSTHVAHLGTVLRFKAKSIMNKAGMSLGIPKWMCDAVADTLIERSSKDSRAQQTFEETFSATDLGKKLVSEYPEISTVYEAEDHASNAGSHAAGAIITNDEIVDYVAIDNRTGTIMADKDDCEKLNLLKIDCLGLAQLSIFERCLELIGVPPRNGFLEELPLDDLDAFEVLNKRQYSGIFQAMGKSLQILFNMIKTDRLDDLIAITSLSRPGPVASGGAVRWCRKRSGTERVSYLHPLLEPYLSETYGEMIYQEQIMMIARDIGKMGVRDVHHIRKAMSKSMGSVEMNKIGEPFKAIAKDTLGEEITDRLWGQMIQFGAWAFNKAHAASYGVITYYCCWLKAYYPVEFAAATLDSESDPLRQLYQLRELAVEGVEYKPIDADASTDRWSIKIEKEKKILVGPLNNIKGIGPVTVKKIMDARISGAPLTPSIRNKLALAQTKIDSLTPIRDAINKLHPDLTKINIFSKPVPIYTLSAGMPGNFMIFCLIKRIQPRDLNDLQSLAKRAGRRIEGQSWVLRLFVNDDTDEILCQIDRHDYLTVGKKIEEIGGQGDALYAIKGTIPDTFRMIKITHIRYLGKISDLEAKKIKIDLFAPVEPIVVTKLHYIAGDIEGE